jgi:hypothetical protein
MMYAYIKHYSVSVHLRHNSLKFRVSLVEGQSCQIKVLVILNFDHQFKILTNVNNLND